MCRLKKKTLEILNNKGVGGKVLLLEEETINEKFPRKILTHLRELNIERGVCLFFPLIYSVYSIKDVATEILIRILWWRGTDH